MFNIKTKYSSCQVNSLKGHCLNSFLSYQFIIMNISDDIFPLVQSTGITMLRRLFMHKFTYCFKIFRLLNINVHQFTQFTTCDHLNKVDC